MTHKFFLYNKNKKVIFWLRLKKLPHLKLVVKKYRKFNLRIKLLSVL